MVESSLQVDLVMLSDTHNKEFQCPVCAKYFSRKFTLDAHMLIHRGEKPHSCQFCGKSFRQKGTLMRHKALHSTKNLFHCTLCNHGFRQKNVFIFHLRHRHNVSTETLDRRKYRTEPKDYQSIMDTLPPFVHVDSAAIASSEKHFDAILYESIQNPGSNSEALLDNHAVESNLQDADNSAILCNGESISSEDHVNVSFYNHNNLKSKNYSSVGRNNHKGYIKEVQSSINSNFTKNETIELPARNSSILPVGTVYPLSSSHQSNITQSVSLQNYNNSKSNTYAPGYRESHKGSCKEVQSSIVSNFIKSESTELSERDSSLFPVDTVVSGSSHLNNVTNSGDLVCETITCIPCKLDFNSEADFKYHMKTHVQSVLLAEVVADEAQKLPDVSYTQRKGSRSLDDLTGPTLLLRGSSSSRRVDTADSQTFCDKMNFTIKAESLDPENVPSVSQNAGNSQSPSFLLENSTHNRCKIKCPICNVCLDGDSSFKEHSRNHDSYSLLKLISESFGNRDASLSYQNHPLPLDTESSSNCSTKQLNKNNKLKQKVKNVNNCAKKSVVQAKNAPNKNCPKLKRSFACMQCGKTFPNKYLLEYHRQLHLSIKGFFCKCCRKNFLTKKLLLFHTRLHHLKSFKCFVCSKIFNYRKLFNLHQRQCVKSPEMKTVNGNSINFPVMNIESLLKFDSDDIVGIIPVCTEPEEGKRLQMGIPIMSVSQIKALYMLQTSCLKDADV